MKCLINLLELTALKKYLTISFSPKFDIFIFQIQINQEMDVTFLDVLGYVDDVILIAPSLTILRNAILVHCTEYIKRKVSKSLCDNSCIFILITFVGKTQNCTR